MTVTACTNLLLHYVKCLKVFFGYDKFSSVPAMLMDVGLPSCNTIMLNAKTIFLSRLRACPNKFVQAVNCLISM